MEELNKILRFISDYDSGYGYNDDYNSIYGAGSGAGSGYDFGDGSGYGAGYGAGSGAGSGYDFGAGYGDGYGFGAGYGAGYGAGDGYGSGDGYGDGYGAGYGAGDGYGSGDGSSKIKIYVNSLVFYVDNIPTIFEKIKGNVAHCQIINKDDFSAKKCYLVKGNGHFSHGETLEEARQSLREKIFAKLNTKERIQKFVKNFNNTDVYSANDFFDWHSILTGSCLMGRKHFIETHNIDMKRKYTVKEFISICENDYGGEIIKQLKTYY